MMKNLRLLGIFVSALLAAQGLFPLLLTAADADPVISVPEELGGGYLISAGRAMEAGLATAADADQRSTPHILTVVVTGTSGEVSSSPKGLYCVHGGAGRTVCSLPVTARGVVLHARVPAISPIVACKGTGMCYLPLGAGGKALRDTTSVIKDWAAATADVTVDISKRCGYESPTCSFNVTEDMTVTATFGTDPAAKVMPATTALKPFDFGKVKVGKTKTTTFAVKNVGATRLTIGSIDVDASDSSFAVPATTNGKTADKCTIAPLEPGKSCTFKVVFTPAAASNKPVTATVSVASDDAGSPDHVYIQGIGYSDVVAESLCGRCAERPGVDCTRQCARN